MDGPVGQNGVHAQSPAVGVSSGVIARVLIPDPRCSGTIASVTVMRTGFAPHRVAQVFVGACYSLLWRYLIVIM